MRLSSKGEYACLAVLDLAERHGKGFVRTEDIASRKKIPRKYLEQILLSLNRAGYVKSRRGAEGGCMLAKPPEDISVAEIIRLMDGALAPVNSVSRYFYEHTPIEKSRKILSLFREIRDYTAKKLESSSFADMVEK